MRRVVRTEIPEKLEKEGPGWTSELLNQIRLKGGYSAVDDKYKTRYNIPAVREALSEMYRKCCCYCEGDVDVTSYGRIEHLKPRAKFPKLTYDWKNLHWSCERCNGNKNDKWDASNPVLDPTADDIDEYMQLNLRTGMYETIEKGECRGKTTIEFVGLNRKELVEKRHSIFIMIVREYKLLRMNKEKNSCIKELERVYGNKTSYYSVYHNTIEKLKRINY